MLILSHIINVVLVCIIVIYNNWWGGGLSYRPNDNCAEITKRNFVNVIIQDHKLGIMHPYMVNQAARSSAHRRGSVGPAYSTLGQHWDDAWPGLPGYIVRIALHVHMYVTVVVRRRGGLLCTPRG